MYTYQPVPGKSNHLTIVDPKFYAEDFLSKKAHYVFGLKNCQKQKNSATNLLSLKAAVPCR